MTGVISHTPLGPRQGGEGDLPRLPPLARVGLVGLSEADAQRQDVGVRVARLPMTSVLRA